MNVWVDKDTLASTNNAEEAKTLFQQKRVKNEAEKLKWVTRLWGWLAHS